MIIDKIHIKVKAGNGGNGAVSFDRTRKPNGGDGGIGGNVIFRGTTNLQDLTKVQFERNFSAPNAEHGGSNRRYGANGEDRIIFVPITTIIYNAQNNQELGRITDVDTSIIIAKGGRGGLGNWNFKKGQLKTLKKHTNGEVGESFDLILELNLKADIAFIGFPNAGKSSLLNLLTNASSKVASYPFTTLEPHLGVAHELVLMDLPGLIEGTVEGKGLGARFTKHTKYTRLIAHLVSLENSDPLDSYQRMRNELKSISAELADKPEVILLTKTDLVSEVEVNKKLREFKKLNKNIIAISNYIHEDSQRVLEFFRENIKNSV